MTAYFLGSGTEASPGRIGRVRAANRAMTQAEMSAQFFAGVAEADRGASVLKRYLSNFGSGVDGWGVGSGRTITGNQDGIDGEDDWAVVSNPSSTLTLAAARHASYETGKKSRTKVKVHNPAGSGLTHFGVLCSEAAYNTGVVVKQFKAIPAGTTAEFNFEDIAGQTVCYVVVVNSSGAIINVTTVQSFYFKSVDLESIGNTVNLSPAGIQLAPGQWLDHGGNKAHVHIPDGCRLLNPATEGQIQGRNTWSSSDAIQYVTGIDAPVLPINAIIRVYAKASVSSTFDLGDGVDQDRYAAGVTIGTEWAPVALLKHSHDVSNNRDLTVKPTASYSGIVDTLFEVELVA